MQMTNEDCRFRMRIVLRVAVTVFPKTVTEGTHDMEA